MECFGEVRALTKDMIDRINELAHLAKERELTEEELAERAALRKEYIEEFRRGTIELLENTYIQTPDCLSISSTSVVLPWSTWAMMAIFRSLSIYKTPLNDYPFQHKERF